MNLPLLGVLALLVHLGWAAAAPPPPTASALCTIAPGSVLALVRVEQDTSLPHGATGAQPMSASGVRPGPQDSLLASPGTPMPAARVTLLDTDSATRALLEAAGIHDARPQAYLRAAPYRADCRTIRWTDTVPFVVRGELGYVRAHVLPPALWIDGRPLLVIPDVWNYPYPRRRGLAALATPADAPLTPAAAMFSYSALMQLPRPTSSAGHQMQDSTRRDRALAWAREHAADAELEPVRTLVLQVVLAPDWARARALPSRLRGSYRVELEAAGRRVTWYFRTHDRPGYQWLGRYATPRTAGIVQDPYVRGYRLVGLAANSPDSPVTALEPGPEPAPLVWLSTSDRPTTHDNYTRTVLTGTLEFRLEAVPEYLWDELDLFIPRPTATDSAMRARFPVPRGREQARLPITVRLTDAGDVRADTVLLVRGRPLKLLLQRIDTISIRRPW